MDTAKEEIQLVTSHFFTFASCVPDTLECSKTQNNSWHASCKTPRMIYQFEDFHSATVYAHTPTQIFKNTLGVFRWHKQTSFESSQCLVCP